MKTTGTTAKCGNCGLTLTEVCVILVLVVLLGLMLLPTTVFEKFRSHKKVWTINCVSNLRQIGIGMKFYAKDNNGLFPMQFAATNSDAKQFIENVHAFQCFQIVSNELGNETKILVCPFDINRSPAVNYGMLTDSNVSYFFNTDAIRSSATNSILCGDRFLENNGKPVRTGPFVLTTNLKMSWAPHAHNGGGNLLYSDGSVQQTTSRDLNPLIQGQPLATNRLLIP